MALINVKGAGSAPSEIRCAGFRYIGSGNYDVALFTVTFDGTNYNIQNKTAIFSVSATGPYTWTGSADGSYGYSNFNSGATDIASLSAGYGYFDATSVTNVDTYLTSLSIPKASVTAAAAIQTPATNTFRIVLPV